MNHIHEREVSDKLNLNVDFMPHVAPFFQGISLTVNTRLSRNDLSRGDVVQMFQSYFQNEPLISVCEDENEEVTVKTHGTGRHGVTLGSFKLMADRLVIVSVIDNLLKGAATQCLQNMNLALELNEFEGILPSKNGDREELYGTGEEVM